MSGALTSDLGGMLTELVEAQRGLTDAEVDAFLTAGELPDLAEDPEDENDEDDEPPVLHLGEARAFLAGLPLGVVAAGGFSSPSQPHYESPVRAVFKFNPNQPRDYEGKWTDTGLGGPLGTAPTKKITPAVVYKKHADGAVVAESADRARRIRWDADRRKFVAERRTGAAWQETETLTKSATYDDVKQPGKWFEPGKAPTPAAPKKDEPATLEPGTLTPPKPGPVQATKQWPFTYEQDQSVQVDYGGSIARSSDQEYAADPDFRRMTVPVSSLTPSQDDDEEEFGTGEEDEQVGAPLVAIKDGRWYLVDGHHRAKKAGRDGSLDAWVIDLDAPATPTAPPSADEPPTTNPVAGVTRVSSAADAAQLAAEVTGDDERSEYIRRALGGLEEFGPNVATTYVSRDASGKITGAMTIVDHVTEGELTEDDMEFTPYSVIDYVGATGGGAGTELVRRAIQHALDTNTTIYAEPTPASDTFWRKMGFVEDPLGEGTQFVGLDHDAAVDWLSDHPVGGKPVENGINITLGTSSETPAETPAVGEPTVKTTPKVLSKSAAGKHVWMTYDDPGVRAASLWAESYDAMNAVRQAARNIRDGKTGDDVLDGVDLDSHFVRQLYGKKNSKYTRDDLIADVLSAAQWMNKRQDESAPLAEIYRGIRVEPGKLPAVGKEIDGMMSAWTGDITTASHFANWAHSLKPGWNKQDYARDKWHPVFIKGVGLHGVDIGSLVVGPIKDDQPNYSEFVVGDRKLRVTGIETYDNDSPQIPKLWTWDNTNPPIVVTVEAVDDNDVGDDMTQEPTPAETSVSAPVPNVTSMREAYDAGATVLSVFTSGQNAGKVELLELSDGTRAVRKTLKKLKSGTTPKLQARREVLVGKVMNAFGFDDIFTEKLSDKEVLTTHIDGDVGYRVEGSPADAAQRPGGREIAILDWVTANGDRTAGNWIVTPNGDVKPIDHSNAGLETESVKKYKDALMSPFIDYWLRPVRSFKWDPITKMKPRLTHADVADFRKRLESLRVEFAAMNEVTTLNRMLWRLDRIESSIV